MKKILTQAQVPPPIASKQSAPAATADALKAITNGWHALNYALQYVPDGDFLRPKMLLNLQALAAARDRFTPPPDLVEALELILSESDFSDEEGYRSFQRAVLAGRAILAKTNSGGGTRGKAQKKSSPATTHQERGNRG